MVNSSAQSSTTQQQARRIPLTSQERKVSTNLALLFAVRMLGLFLLTPVFAEAAKQLSGGDNLQMVGMAIGAYGLTQAIMQIPFGMLSDKFGRRPIIIIGMLLFIIGGVICALANSVTGVAIGRAIQGFGAVSAAITAWIADSTRPEVRARAMAMVGGSIGLSFAASLVLSPLLVEYVGLSGLFWVISLLGFVCLLLATFFVPVVPMHDQAMADVPITQVLKNDSLLRLNGGVFCLHFTLMSLFVVLPSLFVQLGGLTLGALWKVYLPVIVVALVLMVPAVFYIETRQHHKSGFVISLGVLVVLMLAWLGLSQSYWGSITALLVFFVLFNVLEALIPSMVSRVTPPQHKGLALGLYNMFQAFGVATGGAVGGILARHASVHLVFLMAALLLLLCSIAAYRMKAIAYVA
ncbi:MFS transporter [Pelistega europaea]|uniref:MFS transporter n=1 Tax=Pelistega europaea TaxID=106147 RepID=A0A7Y4L872_9BURK|nr:MFS transporter [Pelistega europaea]NOL48744.1 MFS transporter [Pelistega europaea]